MATTRNSGAQKPPAEDAAARSRDYVRRHWRYREPSAAVSGNCRAVESAGGTRAIHTPFDRVLSHGFCISGMAFQDAWNIDLERLQRCCVHVATAPDKLVPFCAYYLTDTSGRRLPVGRGFSPDTSRLCLTSTKRRG